MSYPIFTLPVTLTAAFHIRVWYDDGSDEDVAIGAGTYYPDGSGTSSDLLQALSDALNAQATSKAWALTQTGDGRLVITASPAMVEVDRWEFLTTELRPRDLGMAADNSDLEMDFTADAFTCPFRRRWAWMPDTNVIKDHVEQQKWIVSEEAPNSADADVTYYGSYHLLTVGLRFLRAAYVYQHYLDQAAYATSAGLQTGDPNASLEALWDDMVDMIENGVVPTLRYAKDIGSASTFTLLRITSPDWLGALERGAATQANPGPLLYDVSVKGRVVT